MNPRASRTIPFVVEGDRRAARVARGARDDRRDARRRSGSRRRSFRRTCAVKEAVFPFSKFREFDPILGPEMRSTGEVMGIADSFGTAFAKAQIAADNALPTSGRDLHHGQRQRQAQRSSRSRGGSTSWGSACTRPRAPRGICAGAGIPSTTVFKVHEGRPHAIDLIVNRDVQLLINTPLGKHAQRDDYSLRQAAIAHHVPYTTTLSAASAACDASSRSARASRPCGRCRNGRRWRAGARRYDRRRVRRAARGRRRRGQATRA